MKLFHGLSFVQSFTQGVLWGLTLWMLPWQTRATAVYLKPNNPSPTGHIPREKLEERIKNFKRFIWIKVKNSKGQKGWVLQSLVLRPIDFSQRAHLYKGEIIYKNSWSEEIQVQSLERWQLVPILKRHEDWYQILYKEGKEKKRGWVRAHQLHPDSKDPGYFYPKQRTALVQKPSLKSIGPLNIVGFAQPGTPLIPLKVFKNWVWVQMGKVKGYIPLNKVHSRLITAQKAHTSKGSSPPHWELFGEKIFEIFSDPLWLSTGNRTLELKSKPHMASPTTAQLSPWQNLKLQGYKVQKWTLSQVPQWGKLWWLDKTPAQTLHSPSNGGKKVSYHLKISEIYQIEESPIIKNLKFATTAKGVFRSFDGRNWSPLPGFIQAQPIHVSPQGVLFVGDQVSFNQGQSFQPYVRWDKVLKALPKTQKQAPIHIIDVDSHRKDFQQVTLRLKSPGQKSLKVYTPNLGGSWLIL